MTGDDVFEPRLGRMRAKGKAKPARKFVHRAIAAANLARGGAAGSKSRGSFSGGRIGRGAGVGRVLSARDRYAAFRARRVIVKARRILLRGKGIDAAKAHLRYVERDGTTREGGRGKLYGPASDAVDRSAWIDNAKGDRHQFRFIVSPEDGLEYDDLKPLTRRLMAGMEEDLGTRLDWVAVDHHNTGHPHTHIIVRGRDDRGKDLIIARDYIRYGLRERACEVVDIDLGPRSDRAIELRLRAEVDQERLTSIDRTFLRESACDILVSSNARGAFDQAIRVGRLQTLERFGLAKQEGQTHWRLAPDLEATLRKMGERDDIIRTMQRAYYGRAAAPPIAELAIHEPDTISRRRLIGAVVERGLSDEHADRHYVIVEGVDGRSHYVELGKADQIGALPTGAVVNVAAVVGGVRPSDRTITEVAAVNDGIYTIDAHLRHDTSATQAFAETHLRRLEAMRRSDVAERQPDGSWVIAPDHLARVARYEAERARDNPVTVEILSLVSVARLVDADAATWLDSELVADRPEFLRAAGFGAEVETAKALRRQWLINEGLAYKAEDRTVFRRDMVKVLQRRELLRLSEDTARDLGKPFTEVRAGEQVAGMLRKSVEGVGGRYGLVERARDFTLVPWRPVLEQQVGKSVAGVIRDGAIDWKIGRQRSGPVVT